MPSTIHLIIVMLKPRVLRVYKDVKFTLKFVLKTNKSFLPRFYHVSTYTVEFASL